MLAAFSITPLGTGESVGAAVAGAVRLVRESGLPNETNAMFTNIEGTWDDVMGLIHACVDEVAQQAPRVSVVIKLDVRPGHDDALTAKLESVERHLAVGAAGGGRADGAGGADGAGDGADGAGDGAGGASGAGYGAGDGADGAGGASGAGYGAGDGAGGAGDGAGGAGGASGGA
jgi:uncharacterized protein (TIGR00106 family)